MSSSNAGSFRPSTSDPVYPPTRPPKIQSIQIPLEVVFDRETTMKQISRLENLIRDCRRDIKKFIDVTVSTENVEIRRHKSGDYFVGRNAGKFNEELRRRQEELDDLLHRREDLHELCKENPITEKAPTKEEISTKDEIPTKKEEVEPTPVSSLFEPGTGFSLQDLAKAHVPFTQYPMIYPTGVFTPMIWPLHPYPLVYPTNHSSLMRQPPQVYPGQVKMQYPEHPSYAGQIQVTSEGANRRNYIRYYDKKKMATKSRQSALSQYHAGRGPRPPPHELTDKTLLIERKSVDPILTSDSQGNPLNVRCFHSVNGQPLVCDCTYDNNVYILSENSQLMKSKGLLVIDQDLLYLQKLDLTRNRVRSCENRWLHQNSLAQAPLVQNSLSQAPLVQNSLSQAPLVQNSLAQSPFTPNPLTSYMSYAPF